MDPGEVFGVAVIADEAVIDTENCFSIEETLNKIKNILKTVDFSRSAVSVKIGSGVPVYRNCWRRWMMLCRPKSHWKLSAKREQTATPTKPNTDADSGT